MAQELITIVNIQRSREGSLYESTITRKTYDKMLEKGRLNDWVLKDSIESITTTPSDKKTSVEIITEKDPDIVSLVDDISIDDMDLEELRAEHLRVFGKAAHPAAKEKGLIKKLKENK